YAGQGFVGVARAKVTGNGTAVAFIAVGPAAQKARYQKVTGGLMKSLRIMSDQQVAQGGQAWRSQLAGRALVQYDNQGDYSGKQRADFCSNGSYRYVSSSTYVTNGAISNFSGVGRNE